MKKVGIALAAALAALAMIAGIQLISAAFSYFELKDDLHDMSASLGPRIGLAAASSDQDLRNKVVEKAGEHGIELDPDQVMVSRTDHLYLRADYNVPLQFPGLSVLVHFSAASGSE